MLGIPLALEKVEGPSQCLTFLGITLDTKLMLARLPDDKLFQIRSQVAAWLALGYLARKQRKERSYP